MTIKLVRTPGIYLVGFMGSGKTTVGRLLADRLGWSFVDLDAEIEARQGTSIAELFDRHGEDHFRRLEAEAIRGHVRQIQMGKPAVIALGGGAFAQPANCALLADNGVTVWLDCPLELARRRVAENSSRPLARDLAKFEELYRLRQTSYARADFRVEAASDDPEIVIDAIMRLPIF